MAIIEISLATLVGYLFGSIPAAYILSRMKGVNIFEEGTKQAGTTNVWITVSAKYGLAVFITDAIKGLCAILFARWLGVTGLWLMFPAVTAILGHWNSPFTGFRGGDGVASMSGLALGFLGFFIAISFPILLIVSLGFHSNLKNPVLWGVLASYIVMLIVTPLLNIFYSNLTLIDLPEPWTFLFTVPDMSLYLGMVVISLFILLHSYRYHKSHTVINRRTQQWQKNAGED